MKKPLESFKAYDVRGRVPEDLDQELAYRIGLAFGTLFSPGRVVVGQDVRHSSASLSEALGQGLNETGCDVLDIGLSGTEQVYFATFAWQLDGGIMVTASHNPPGYNGMKFVREDAIPVSGDTGLRELQRLVEEEQFRSTRERGKIHQEDVNEDYIQHLLGYVDRDRLRPLRLAVNPGNGSAGPVMDLLSPELPFELMAIYSEPDGDFPNGVPNPLLVENRQVTADLVRKHNADLGLAWDGDYDRCFFFDSRGDFVEGYYIVGLLARAMLEQYPGSKIIHDPRLVWNTREIVAQHGGEAVQSKTGHAFIKERMRKEDAIYGGEMSAHHYFRKFSYCDSGMIPWLLMAELISKTGQSLSEMVAECQARYPVSGEINREVEDPDRTLTLIEERYQNQATDVDYTDGVSMEFGNWRFNIRKSNTEPLIRLNVETRADAALLEEKTRELLEQMV